MYFYLPALLWGIWLSGYYAEDLSELLPSEELHQP